MDNTDNLNIYQQNGYDNRDDYLQCLAEDFGVPFKLYIVLLRYLERMKNGTL